MMFIQTVLDLKFAGAHLRGTGQCEFSVWAPLKETMSVYFPETKRKLEMQKDRDGYFNLVVDGVSAETRYFYMPDGKKQFPDPASHFQPDGVHGPSQVVDHDAFQWNDNGWKGIPFKEMIIYELHVGTFTPEGTFDAIAARLDDLRDVGVNAIEIMPVGQFPGNRNWGYDGVYIYAVQNSYGGPDGLKRLVDACHRKGIAVILDVVYNHVGPEGNYLPQFGPYFTNKYWTPWGDAINFDKEWCDGVRDYFCSNALYWFEYFHIDGLRLDAIHMVHDEGAVHFWHFLSRNVSTLEQHVGRPLYLIGESDLNSPRTLQAPENGGYGFQAQWLDDFHHALTTIVDPNARKRYYDFGSIEQLAKAYTNGFVHSGEYVRFRKRKYGSSSAGIPGDRFVAFNMNHDQVGNRPLGERLCMLVDFERVKVAAAALLFAPYVPLLFMGEEYGDRSPFFYFVSHSDEALIASVRKGRAEEFKDFKDERKPPDPQDEKTFFDSRIQWESRTEGDHRRLLLWHKELITLRRELPAVRNFRKDELMVNMINEHALIILRQNSGGMETAICMLNFAEAAVQCTVPFSAQRWQKVLDSADKRWNNNPTAKQMQDQINGHDPFILPGLTAGIYKSIAAP